MNSVTYPPSLQGADTSSLTKESIESYLTTQKKLLSFRIHLQPILTEIQKLPLIGGIKPDLLYNSNKVESQSISILSQQILTKILRILPDEYKNEYKQVDDDHEWEKRKENWKNQSLKCEQDLWEVIDNPLNKLKKECMVDLDYWKNVTQLKHQQSFQVLDQPPSQQINNALKDIDKWLNRTQPSIKASNIIGLEEENSELIEKIQKNSFNDQDFYTILLKEAISINTDNDINNSIDLGSTAFKNQNKEKKTAEEKHSSKGRKLNQDVIPKLENFMTTQDSYSFYNNNNSIVFEPSMIDQLMISLFKDDEMLE